jgi:C-terminal processing protease CtpA/Prc
MLRLLLLAFLVGCAACGGTWNGSIGAVLAKDNRDGRVYVREAPADMGAARAGVLVNDEITAIDGKPARDLSPEQIHKALYGEVGTKVSLSISRSGVARTIEVERGPLKAGDAGPGPQ